MASQYPVVKNGAGGAVFYIGLPSVASSGSFQVNPTLAIGDVKITKDDGALANLTTLPSVSPAGSKRVKVTLSQAETDADNLGIIFSDAAGDEWGDLLVNIQTTARKFDDLAFPITTGRGILVGSDGKLSITDGAIAAATFAANALAAVWSSATRTLTGGNNIVLAKGTGITGFNDISTAQVNAEVLDVLTVDTHAQPGQGAPPATASFLDMLRYLYKAWRNRHTQTADQFSIYADNATTVDHKAAVNDDGTTFDRGEMGTGP